MQQKEDAGLGEYTEDVSRRVPRDPPAPVVTVADLATPAPSDRRIRSVVGDYRVVIPDGVQKSRRFFTNNSSLVIEKRGKDATGAEKWDRVMLFSKPKPGDKIDSEMVDLHALYWLLAGPDAE
jgi:hypothetical protein